MDWLYHIRVGSNCPESESRLVVSDSLWPHRLLTIDPIDYRPHRLYNPWDSPGQNTGVSSHSLLQGICSTQGSNPCLWHCSWILYQLNHKGSPRTLDWGDYLFSSSSSQPRNWTRISCIAERFFTNWAFREAIPIQLTKRCLADPSGWLVSDSANIVNDL